jgi:hypothetical protein
MPAGGGARRDGVRTGGCWRRCSSRRRPRRPSAATGRPSPRCSPCCRPRRPSSRPPIHHHEHAGLPTAQRRPVVLPQGPPIHHHEHAGLPTAQRRPARRWLHHHHEQADHDGNGLLWLDGDGSCDGLPRGPPTHHHERRVYLRRGDGSTTTTSKQTATATASFGSAVMAPAPGGQRRRRPPSLDGDGSWHGSDGSRSGSVFFILKSQFLYRSLIDIINIFFVDQ